MQGHRPKAVVSSKKDQKVGDAVQNAPGSEVGDSWLEKAEIRTCRLDCVLV